MKNIITWLFLLSTFVQADGGCNPTPNPDAKVSLVHAFPVGTWVENLAVRDNSKILATLATSPMVWQVDPADKKRAVPVATVPNHISNLGISQTTPDKFYVAAANFSLATGDEGNGESTVYELDVSKFNGKDPIRPKHIADFPKAGLLNGMTTLNAAKGLLLIADSTGGAVWRLNVKTGKKKRIIADPLMEKRDNLGVNGVKTANGHLYWTNTDGAFVARAPIDASGSATGPGQVVAMTQHQTDDFTLGDSGHGEYDVNGFVAGSDEITRFRGADVSVYSNRTLLADTTAVMLAPKAHGKSCRDLYVTTNGGSAQYEPGNKITVPGRIVKVHC